MKQEKRENISEIKRRILQYVESIGITREEFYKHASLNGANFRGRSALSELSADKIANILRCYEDIDPDWLLLGKGEMIRSKNPKNTSEETLALKIILEKDARIEQLVRENERLLAQVSSFKDNL